MPTLQQRDPLPLNPMLNMREDDRQISIAIGLITPLERCRLESMNVRSENTVRPLLGIIHPMKEAVVVDHPSPSDLALEHDCLELDIDETDRLAFESRYVHNWPRLVDLLNRIYRGRADLTQHLDALRNVCTHYWAHRPKSLKMGDAARTQDPAWFTSPKWVGATLYVDLFAETFAGLTSRIPYLQALGVNYVHLMPCFESPEGQSDGGYAVNSYRRFEPSLGDETTAKALIDALHDAGMVVVFDFVFNHTSDDHDWARCAKNGEAKYQNFFYTYDDRELPDRYDETLREIFPSVRRGSFSWDADLGRWVWTSFNSFQWDLNYRNPEVFVAMAGEMLALANLGVDVLRLDAVAFLWKQLGTVSENLPEAHALIQAFNCVCRISAPGLVFKSEAIVHPNDVERYIDPTECQLSYNPTLMALLWEAVATRQTGLLARSLSYRQSIKPGTCWVNYLRCHDDIGWSFDDHDAWQEQIDPDGHRRFLNDFYSGQFEGSFARGVPFQYNPTTHDMRICGTLASLVGVEDAIQKKNPQHLHMALERARMMYALIMSVGGIPLIYMGEECGVLNDYQYVQDPEKSADSRWVHRIAMDWSKDPSLGHTSHDHGFFEMISELVRQRKSQPALGGTIIEVLETTSPHVLLFRRIHAGHALIVCANFSEHTIPITSHFLPPELTQKQLTDVLRGERLGMGHLLKPYSVLWCPEETNTGSTAS